MPKQKMVDLLYELMKNSKRSDRELAKVVKVSQPTITRMRKNLEKSGFICEYTVMPALEKLGFEIMALNFISAGTGRDPANEAPGRMLKSQKVLFATSGGGLNGRTHLLLSIHKDFTDYSAFAHELRDNLGPKADSMESFLVSLKNDVIKCFSLRDLERIQQNSP